MARDALGMIIGGAIALGIIAALHWLEVLL